MSACVFHLKSPPLSLSIALSAGRWLQVASKVTRHLVVGTGAGHMLGLLWKAVFPVRQAYVRAKSCCYIGGLVYFIVVSVCSLHPRTSGYGDCAEIKGRSKSVFFFY